MKYDHMVKIGGKYYPAGAEISNDAPQKEIEENSLPLTDKDIELEGNSVSKPSYSKTEINRMSTAELQNLASNTGIENAYSMTGAELKKLLIKEFNL